MVPQIKVHLPLFYTFYWEKPCKDKDSPDYVPSIFNHGLRIKKNWKPPPADMNVQKKRRAGPNAEVLKSTTKNSSILPDPNDGAANGPKGEGSPTDGTTFFPDPNDGAANGPEGEGSPFNRSIAVQAQPNVSDVAVQIDEDSLIQEMNNLSISILNTEKQFLMTKNSCLQQQSMLSLYDPAVMFENDEASTYFTGLTWNTFNIICSHLSPHLLQPRRNIPTPNQTLMVLVRLRLCLPLNYLSMQNVVLIGNVNATFQKIIDLIMQSCEF